MAAGDGGLGAALWGATAWGVPASSLDIVVDRLHVRRRLRAGEPVTAVPAPAAQWGIDLRLTP